MSRTAVVLEGSVLIGGWTRSYALLKVVLPMARNLSMFSLGVERTALATVAASGTVTFQGRARAR